MKFGGWALQCVRGIGRKGLPSPLCSIVPTTTSMPVCLLPPSFTSGPCSFARHPASRALFWYWFKWPDRVSLLCTDPPTDWFSDRSTTDWQWSNGGLEVVLMGIIYLYCKYHSLTRQVPPPTLITLSTTYTTVGLVGVMSPCRVIGGVEQAVV